MPPAEPQERTAASRAELLKRLAKEEGFELAGICRPEPSKHMGYVEDWLEEGYHGTMAYLERPDTLSRRGDVGQLLREARSMLIVGHNYDQRDPAGLQEDPSRAIVARYARGRDYHRVVARGLRRVHSRFEDAEGSSVSARAYVDTGPVLERELAERAGLGWFGQNTMLIHPRRGSYFFLGILLLGAEVEPDAPMARDHCGSCRACLDACPTSALLGRAPSGAPVMDASRCISYVTIEHRGPIPRELRPLVGNRIYGCDICQEVCPFNERFSTPAKEPGYAHRGPGERPPGVEAEGEEVAHGGALPEHPGTNGPPLVELMEMDETGWESLSRGSAIRRVGRSGFRRNVAVALGNWGDPEAAPALVRAFSDPDPLVRGHVGWALGELASDEAKAALSAALANETDESVREELILAQKEADSAGSGPALGER